ncbi:MAG: PLD nuclease N-terminal domain-containing protein [Flavobacteriaceae bacterium]|nr:PLD nuclease N-terminal domain-containing protein [Flavobacteriaceae bacterium]
METTLIIGFGLLTIILWFWAIIDIVRSRFKNRSMNTFWLLAVLFFPILGSIFYFQLKKEYVTKAPRKFKPNFNRTELETAD